jgi:hypothetical protein
VLGGGGSRIKAREQRTRRFVGGALRHEAALESGFEDGLPEYRRSLDIAVVDLAKPMRTLLPPPDEGA